MKKKAIIIVCLVAAVLAVVAVLLLMNAPVEIPSKEMAYLQLDTKGEEFVLEQIKGVPRERLIECWGEPDGGLFGFFGDIWEISEDECIVVYYSDNAEVEEIRLNRGNKDNDDSVDNFPENYGIGLSAENVSDTSLTLAFENTSLPAGSVSIGRDFAIQVFENGEWKELEPKTEPVFLTDALVPTDNKWSVDIDWEWLYGQLPAGRYRISQSVRVSTGFIGTSASYQEEENFTMWAEFDIDQQMEE